MDREKRTGIILIIIGVLIPLSVLPLVSGFSREKGFYGNFYEAGVDLPYGGDHSGPSELPPPTKNLSSKPRITWSSLMPHRIPYRLFLIPTIILAYMGIIRIDRARRKKEES